jgi:hypothetical protein
VVALAIFVKRQSHSVERAWLGGKKSKQEQLAAHDDDDYY